MLPQSEEILLEDEEVVRPISKRPRWIRVGIPLLFCIAIAIGIYGAFSYKTQPLPALVPGPLMSPTPYPKTNTFVDGLFGSILYFQGGSLFEISLPDRISTEIVGVDGDDEKALVQTPVVWSKDGTLLAIVKNNSELVVDEYASGKYINTYKLRSAVESETELQISMASSNDVLAVGRKEKDGKENLQFFDIASGRELGFFDRCQPKGVWIRSEGFVAKCQLGDLYSVVVVHFGETAASMAPIARDQVGTTYLLLDQYTDTQAFVAKQRGSQIELGTLSMQGKYTPLPQTEVKKLPSPTDALDFYQALAKRIEKETQMTGVSDVSVSSDSSWLTFAVGDKIYVAPLSLKEKPFLLLEGKYARIRPY